MSKASTIIAFGLGVAIGSIGAWYALKKKFEARSDEEIASAKEALTAKYAPKKEEPVNTVDTRAEKAAAMAKEKPSVSEYAKMLSEEGYTNYSNSDVPMEEKNEERKVKREYRDPYVIPPEQFGEIEEYDRISLTYYADHILADDDDEMIENVEDVVGFGSLNHFGEYEDDSVYVRNERLKVDYEILLDLRTYTEVLESKPYLRRE